MGSARCSGLGLSAAEFQLRFTEVRSASNLDAAIWWGVAQQAAAIGPTVTPKTLKEALAADMNLLAAAFPEHRKVATALVNWEGKTVIDVTNAFGVLVEDLDGLPSSAVVARHMIIDLNGPKSIVAGSTAGIGRATAKGLAPRSSSTGEAMNACRGAVHPQHLGQLLQSPRSFAAKLEYIDGSSDRLGHLLLH